MEGLDQSGYCRQLSLSQQTPTTGATKTEGRELREAKHTEARRREKNGATLPTQRPARNAKRARGCEAARKQERTHRREETKPQEGGTTDEAPATTEERPNCLRSARVAP